MPDNYSIQKKIIKIEESKFLSLNINKAKNELNWLPTLSLNECINLTSNWYLSYLSEGQLEQVTEDQIEFFSSK